MAILLVAFPLFSQIVTISDTAFLYALIVEGVDTNGDSLISYAEAEVTNSLDVSRKNISFMSGIEVFINLDTLVCHHNELESLDVSNSPNLLRLEIYDNQITEIDLTQNPLLQYLDVDRNPLSKLDLSQNAALKTLWCGEMPTLTSLDLRPLTALENLYLYNSAFPDLDISNNPLLTELWCIESNLQYLDVSNNPNLKELRCGHNYLTYLDITNNNKLEFLKVDEMPSLHTVCVWETPFPPAEVRVNSEGSPNVYFTTVCVCISDTIVYFPDTALLYALIADGVDANGDSIISCAEALAVHTLRIENVSDVSGIEAFKELDSLYLENCRLNHVDLSSNSKLRLLECQANGMSSINLSGCPELDYLNVSFNQLENLNLTANSKLTHIDCSSQDGGISGISCLDVSKCASLNHLNLSGNIMDKLNLSNNQNLQYLNMAKMSTLNEVCVWTLPFPPSEVNMDTTSSPNIHFTTDCSNQIVFIPDSAFLNVLIESGVDINGDGLISQAEAEKIDYLHAVYTNIYDMMGIEAFINLEILYCSYNNISKLDMSHNPKLKELHCSDNKICELDLTMNQALEELGCSSVWLTDLNLSHNESLVEVRCGGKYLKSLDVSRNLLLKILDCQNGNLANLDLSHNLALERIWIGGNELSSLDLSNNLALKDISCQGNKLTSIDVSHLTSLETLECGSNFLTSLDVSANRNLRVLLASNYCGYPSETNNFESLDVSRNPKLTHLGCDALGLTTLDLSNNLQLLSLSCGYNLFESLDLTNNKSLLALKCSGNPLTSLDLSQNKVLGTDQPGYCAYGITLDQMPSLFEVCVSALPFPSSIWVDTTRSPNITFSDCAPPEFLDINRMYLPDSIYVNISENGRIYSVPEGTGKDINTIRKVCKDSIDMMARTDQAFVLSLLENGNYWLYAQDSTGNISEPEKFTIEGLSRQFRIYPNPVQNQLSIKTSGIKRWSIEITTLNGQQILNGVMEGSTHQIDLSTLKEGVYFITIKSKDFVTTRKIVKL